MPAVNVADARISYQVGGQGEAVLFISGLNGHGSFWRSQIAAFAPSFKTICFDHRGVGESMGAPPYSVELWASDALRLLDGLDIAAAHVVGHSTGGAIAQVMASDYPDRVLSVVLGATWASPDERFREVFGLRREVLRTLGPAAHETFGTILTAPLDAPWTSPDASAGQAVPRTVLDARLEALLTYEGINRLPRIACPAFVLAAEDDVLIPARMSRILADGIPGARYILLPSGGHLFPRSRPEVYNRIVIECLSSIKKIFPSGAERR